MHSLPRLWSVLLGYEVPDVQPVLTEKGELNVAVSAGGRRRLASVVCVCALYKPVCAFVCVVNT